MNKIIGFIFLLVSMLMPPFARAEENDAPVVLELFTSQSFSSCPTADKLLEKLTNEDENIIALSCNVTYWNHLSWKDSLSKEFCNERQRDYVRTLDSRGPYTPQIVISGRETMVGSQEGKIRQSIAKQKKNNPLKPIKLSLENNILNIVLPETPSDHNYAVHLIVYEDSFMQDIPSDENRGLKVNYTNPVQSIISLGTWDGTTKKMNYDVSAIQNAKGYVVVAQKDGKTGQIIAVGKIIK